MSNEVKKLSIAVIGLLAGLPTQAQINTLCEQIENNLPHILGVTVAAAHEEQKNDMCRVVITYDSNYTGEEPRFEEAFGPFSMPLSNAMLDGIPPDQYGAGIWRVAENVRVPAGSGF